MWHARERWLSRERGGKTTALRLTANKQQCFVEYTEVFN